MHIKPNATSLVYSVHRELLPTSTYLHLPPWTCRNVFPLTMDYLDDLSQDAMAAFDGLNCDDSPQPSTALSPKTKLLLHSAQKPKAKPPPRSNNITYLFKLDPPITPAVLAAAAILPTQPRLVHGSCETGSATFCHLNAGDVASVTAWLQDSHPSFRPTFAPINKAPKALSAWSACPTLGLDTTMPQYRPDGTSCVVLPQQEQYPVWYFFYGTLANSAFLGTLFGAPLGSVPVLVPARVYGGKLRTWGGKYNALVDSVGSYVDGSAYEVTCREQEDALCMYETAKYEVVRAEIVLNRSQRKIVQGCTFRFAGGEHELD